MQAAFTMQALQRELEPLKLPAIFIRRAQGAGVDEAVLEDAQDGDTPKPSIIELIITKVLDRAHGA